MKITDEAVEAFTQYRRSQVAELRPWQPGDDMTSVSVSPEDTKAGSPKPGDMIARNPKNHADQWLVAAAYFADNFEPLAALPHLSLGAVSAKPLEWTEYETEGWADRADAEASPFGVFYNITIESDGYRVVFDHEAVGALGVFETADEAKTAAQADYERRIMSALASHGPAPRDNQTDLSSTGDALEPAGDTLGANLGSAPEPEKDGPEVVGWSYEFHDFGAVWGRSFVLNHPDGGANPPAKHFGSPVRNVQPLVRLSALTACQQEVERLRAELITSRNYWSEQCSDLNQRNAELVKALEPFAIVAEHDIGEGESDDDIFWPISNARYSMAGRLRVGHLRRARAALGRQSNG